MPRKILSWLFLFLVLVVSAVVCSAAAQTTINFSPLAQAGGSAAQGVSPSAFHSVGDSYSQDGFTFTATDNSWGPQTLGAWKTRSPNHPLGGKKATSLAAYYAGTRITVTPATGSFELMSIDLAQWAAGQGGGKGAFPVTFHGLRDGNEVAKQTFQVHRSPRSLVLSTYRFKGFTNLTSFYVVLEGTFATGYGFQLNNMVVRSTDAKGGSASMPPTQIDLTGGNVLLEEGFESPVVPTGSYKLFKTGETFSGWKVVGAPGNVAIISGKYAQGGFTFPAQAGEQWLDLTGLSNTRTGIKRTVPTTPGAHYTLSFFVGNMYDPHGLWGTTSTVNVLVNEKRVFTATNTQGKGQTSQVWQKFTTTITATSAKTTIAFMNGDPPADNSNGLDSISLVPEDNGSAATPTLPWATAGHE